MTLASRDVEGLGTEAKRAEGRARRVGWRIAVVGSSTLDRVPDNLLYFLTDGSDGEAIVYLRRGLRTMPGRFERLVSAWCREMGHPEVRWVLPDPDHGAGGAFMRDSDLVRGVDLVLAFFAPGQALKGGTGHVVERAIDSNVPVYSWIVYDDIVAVGSHDPEGAWHDLIKFWFEPE